MAIDQVKLFDFPGAVREGYAFGTQQRLQREGEQKQSALAQLASMAYGSQGPERQGLVQQAIATDPSAGFALGESLQSDDDRRNKSFVNLARLYVGLPEEQKGAFYRAQIVPNVSKWVPNLPADRTPETAQIIDQAAQSIVQAWSGVGGTAEQQNFAAMTQGFTPEQIQEARLIQAGLKPRAGLPSVFDTGAGVVGIDRSSYSYRPITPGGAPSNGIPPRMSEEMIAQRANQMIAQGMPPAEVEAWVSQQMGAPAYEQAPQQLRSAPKPSEAIAMERFNRESRRTLTPQEVAARGFRPGTIVEEDGFGNLEVLQQPPADPSTKPPTEGERAAAGYLQRMESAENELNAIRNAGYRPEANLRDFYTAGEGPLLNWMASPQGQSNRQQQEDWVRAKLRKESGAVIADEEMDREIKTYFPQPGDSEEVIRKKAQSRKRALEQMRIGAGRAAPQEGESTNAAQPAQVQTAADYEALPSGAQFYAPDGTLRRKR